MSENNTIIGSGDVFADLEIETLTLQEAYKMGFQEGLRKAADLVGKEALKNIKSVMSDANKGVLPLPLDEILAASYNDLNDQILSLVEDSQEKSFGGVQELKTEYYKHAVKDAHKYSIINRIEIEASKLIGCFHCIEIFDYKQLVSTDALHFTDDNQTAKCPLCRVDALIGDASGYPVTKDFLKKMHDHWFSEKDKS